MAVVNLGQFGPPRESGIGEGIRKLGEGFERRGMARREIASREKIASEANASREKIAQQTLDVNKADSDAKKTERNVKAANQIIDDLSLHMSGLNKMEQDIFKQSDQYKEMTKAVKSGLPNHVDDAGEIMIRPSKDIYAAKLEQMKAHIQQKRMSGAELTPGEQQADDAFRNIEPKLLAIALDNASKNIRWKTADEAKKAQMVQEQIRILTGARSSLQQKEAPSFLSTALGQDINTGARALMQGPGEPMTPASANEADPFGLLGTQNPTNALTQGLQ